MSRGLGRVQRFALHKLQQQQALPPISRWLDIQELASRWAASGAPTDSGLESVRRAVRLLAKRIPIECTPGGSDIRLALSKEERAAELERIRQQHLLKNASDRA